MGLSESFSRLCHSYLNLADRFQQLDVEHMALKKRLVPLLHNFKGQQEEIDGLMAQNQALSQQLEAMTVKYEAVKSLESVIGPELQSLLKEAEAQADLVDETILEMDSDSMPGLTPYDKQILDQFFSHPEQFAPAEGSDRSGHSVPVEAAKAS